MLLKSLNNPLKLKLLKNVVKITEYSFKIKLLKITEYTF